MRTRSSRVAERMVFAAGLAFTLCVREMQPEMRRLQKRRRVRDRDRLFINVRLEKRQVYKPRLFSLAIQTYIAVVFLERTGEAVVAILSGDEVEVVSLCGIHRCGQG